MKHLSSLLLLFLVIPLSYSQEDPGQLKIEAEINETIWKPFKSSYEAWDWEMFNSLHTDDVLRVHDGGIQQGQEYKDANRAYFESANKGQITIDFVMERRTYAENVGYEVGFYRVIYKLPEKDDYTSYGRFHVVLKKIDGQWKIAQDRDSNSFNGRPIGRDDFDENKKLILIN